MTEKGKNSTFLPEPPYLKKYWLVCESLLVILTFVAVYLTVRLLQHALDRKSNSKTGREIVQKKLLKGLCAASSLAFVFRLICNHAVAFLAWQSDELCFATVTASTVMFCASIYPIYIFLWVRQSIFYTNPVIKKTLNVWVIRISWFTLVFMILTGVAMPFLYNVPAITGWEYRATESGCMEVSEDSAEIAPGISVSFTIFFQIVLLGLFIYPLLSKEMAKFRAPASASPNKSVYNVKNNSLSRSDEAKRRDSEHEEYHDDAFYPSPRPGSPFVRPISPLVSDGRQNFSFERTPRASETDNESTGFPEIITRNEHRPKRKVSAGLYSYTRAQTHSVSSGQVTPAISDTEQPKNKGNIIVGTMKRLRERRRESKRNDERRNRKEGHKLLVMMKNYSRLMAFCVFTDAVTAGIQIAWVLPELIYLLMFDINILINLMCIVLTYAEWQAIIFPCTVDYDNEDTGISPQKLRRRPTPVKRAKRADRVQELKREGKRNRSVSSGRSPSGSGYESGDSSAQICQPAIEMRPLQQTSRT